MAELVYKNTDGKTYTYADQNDLYRVLNETYDSVSGSADFSWFHFSGGDNRVLMARGTGDGVNLGSGESAFHLANLTSMSEIKIGVLSGGESTGKFLTIDSETGSVRQMEVVSVKNPLLIGEQAFANHVMKQEQKTPYDEVVRG